MDHLPIFLNVRDKRTLVAGSGVIAARKADLLLRAGSKVTIVAPELGDELSQLAEKYPFEHKRDDLCAADLEGCMIVFGCSLDDHLRVVPFPIREERAEGDRARLLLFVLHLNVIQNSALVVHLNAPTVL